MILVPSFGSRPLQVGAIRSQPPKARARGTVSYRRRRIRQGGSSAVEFALVLPILVGLCYAIVTYGYVFVLRQILNMAAEEGARAAIAVTTGGPNTLALQQSAATSTAVAAYSFLPSSQQALITPPVVSPFTSGATVGGTSVKVQISMTLTGLFPVMPLPIIGNVPNLPASMTVTSIE